MEYRILGQTGLKVSVLCLGSMQFGWTADHQTSSDVLEKAFDAGINFIDTADVYSRWVEGNPGGISEQIIGTWLKNAPSRRDQLVIATKVRGQMGDSPNAAGLSRLHIMKSVEGSLRRLGIGVIDLYQLHWPDDETPIDETLRALDDLIRQGKVRYIGCSNFKAWQLLEGLWASERGGLSSFVCLQPHYNLVHRAEFERELEAVCLKYRLGVIPYSPLAGGFLTGKYHPGEAPPPDSRAAQSERIRGYASNPDSMGSLQVLKRIAQAYHASPSQIALSWLLARESITSPIIGPRSLEQLQDNLGALECEISEADILELNQVSAWEPAG
jgi:aryl-alcohol dehydrogenase-like predicted oxidoreductase